MAWSEEFRRLAVVWDGVEKKRLVGAKVTGKVVFFVAFGAFIELEADVAGLVHVTELSWSKRIANPSDIHQLAAGAVGRRRRSLAMPRWRRKRKRQPSAALQDPAVTAAGRGHRQRGR